MRKSLFDKSLFGIYLINIDNHLLDFFFHKGKGKPYISFDEINGYHIEKQLANVRHILFEVTDSCNLKCTYCGYGDIYGNHDQRLESNFPLESAKLFLDYMISHLKSKNNDSIYYNVIISFYGGEPLLNISFIKEIVYYIESINVSNLNFIYNITTNALLLNRYMDFLTKKKFRILISLDGNKFNNSYRVNHSGENSFDRVHRLTQEKHGIKQNIFFCGLLTSYIEFIHNSSFVCSSFVCSFNHGNHGVIRFKLIIVLFFSTSF